MYLARGVRRVADYLRLTDNIQKFRTDIGRELINAGMIPHPEDSHWKLNRDIVEAKEDAESTVFEDVGIIVGILPTLLPLFGVKTGIVVQLIGILLTAVLFLREVSIGLLAFDPPDSRVEPQYHEFMRA